MGRFRSNMTPYLQELASLDKVLTLKYYLLYDRNVLRASREMGINRTTLHDKLLHYGLIKGYSWKQRKRHEPAIRFYTKGISKRGKRAKEETQDASASTETTM